MHFVRKSLLGILYPILVISFLAFGLLFSAKMVLGNPRPLEKALHSSGIYDAFISHLISQQQSNPKIGNLQLTPAETRNAIQKAFPQPFIEQSVNTVVDGTYDWLEGRTATPTFRVDITAAKARLADQAAQYVRVRLASLPPCTYTDLAALPPDLSKVNPYELTCLPPGLDQTAVIQETKQAIASNGDLLQDNVIAGDTLKNDDDQTIAEQLHALPDIYHAVIIALYATGSLALVSAVAIVFLHHGRRAGVRRVATTLGVVGVISASLAWIGGSLAQQAIHSAARSTNDSQVLQTKLVAVLQSLIGDLRVWWIGYGVVLMTLGVAVWLMLKYLPSAKPDVVKVEPPNQPSEPTEPAPHKH